MILHPFGRRHFNFIMIHSFLHHSFNSHQNKPIKIMMMRHLLGTVPNKRVFSLSGGQDVSAALLHHNAAHMLTFVKKDVAFSSWIII